MGSLFQGTPQTATSYTTSSTETPKWMQDAIYNQIQMAQNVANTPYQPYSMPTVAELSPMQQQAYQNVQQNQGAWQNAMGMAQTGIGNIASGPGAASSAQPYFDQASSMSGMASASPALQQQANTLGSINFNQPAQTLQPYVNQAMNTKAANAAQP